MSVTNSFSKANTKTKDRSKIIFRKHKIILAFSEVPVYFKQSIKSRESLYLCRPIRAVIETTQYKGVCVCMSVFCFYVAPEIKDVEKRKKMADCCEQTPLSKPSEIKSLWFEATVQFSNYFLPENQKMTLLDCCLVFGIRRLPFVIYIYTKAVFY